MRLPQNISKTIMVTAVFALVVERRRQSYTFKLRNFFVLFPVTLSLLNSPFTSVNPVKFARTEIHFAYRKSLSIKKWTIKRISMFECSNNRWYCYLACKTLFDPVFLLVIREIHLPKPVYLSWISAVYMHSLRLIKPSQNTCFLQTKWNQKAKAVTWCDPLKLF